MKKNLTLGSIFLTGFTLFLIIPLAFVAVFFLSQTYISSKKSTLNKLDTVAEAVAENINSKLESSYNLLTSAADAGDSISFGTSQMTDLLESTMKNSGAFETIYLCDKNKKILYINLGSSSSYSTEDFIGITMSDLNSNRLKNEWSRPLISPVTNKQVIRLSVKYSAGYIAGDISLDFISSIISYSSERESSLFIADDTGDIISSNLPSFASLNISGHPLMQSGKNADRVVFGYEKNGQKYAGTIRRIKISDWYLLYEQPVKFALTFYRQIFTVTLISIGVLLFFSLLVLYFIRIKLIIPMRLLTKRSEMISEGLYPKLSTPPSTVFKELKTLYDSFEKMAVTINKREQELKDKEEHLRSVFDSTTNTGLIIISLDAEPLILDANMGTQIIFGYKMSELLGLPAAGLVIALSDDITKMCSECRATGGMIAKKIDMVKKNGTVFPVLCTISPIYDFGGQLQGYIGVFTDITEITHVQNELEREKERLDVTLKSIGEGVVAADRFGRITLVNKSAENILGKDAKNLMGSIISDSIQLYDYDTGKSITSDITDFSDSADKTCRANMLTNDSKLITIFMTSSAMLDLAGNKIGSVYVFRDITERMKMESELINRKKQLEEINKGLEKRITEETLKRRKNEQMLFEQAKFAAMGQMINAIAHQWRQPLNALALYVQDIEDAYDQGDVNKSYLEYFTASSMKLINHMSGTIDDFRNFFNSGNTVEHVDITRIVTESVSLVATQLKNQLINYSIHINDENFENIYENKVPEETLKGSRKVYASPSELKQVILNILQNARYAITEHRKSVNNNKAGNIDIKIYYKPEKLTLDIENDGGRIPDDVISRIFDPYFTTKPEGEGTGIGLYMSKIMVEEHMDGLLVAENTTAGVRFSITLCYGG